jgi:hypothetical protein
MGNIGTISFICMGSGPNVYVVAIAGQKINTLLNYYRSVNGLLTL